MIRGDCVKKILSLFIVLGLLLAGMPGVLANKYVETGQISLTDADSGKTKAYKAVNLVMGGKDVITDIPAILFEQGSKTRTLVPLRFIIDTLGAQVAWDNDAKEATILLEDKVIVLKADSATALVDGEPYTLPDNVPVKLLGIDYNYRTLVPIRFVSEQLGLHVGWIQETQTVTINKPLQSVKSVRFNNDPAHPELAFKTTGEVEFSSYFVQGADLGGTDQLVVDIANTLFDLDNKADVDMSGTYRTGIYTADIRTVEGYQAEAAPYRTRFVISLDRKMGYEARYDAKTKEIRITFNNSVNQIRTEKIYNAETVIIKTAEAPTYNVKFSDQQVVVDFINARLRFNEGQDGSLAVGKGGIDSISYSQADPGGEYEPTDLISRVAVNLKPGQNPEDIYIEDIGSDLYVYVSGNPLDGFDYGKDSLDSAHLNINTMESVTYATRFDKAANTLEIVLPKEAIDLDTMNLDVDDNVVQAISIKNTAKDYQIRLKLAKGTIFVDNSPSEVTSTLKFIFVNDSLNNTNFQNKLIVIDAGHGGKDPGAISPFSSAKEKDLVLSVAQKLKKKLENIGYKVYMTRDDDTYVELHNRAEIANNLGANAFISLHVNANVKQDPKGIEMLYVPDSRDNKGFAQVLQTEVVKATGAASRGMVSRPNLVVIRETLMPAVLAELGFLSNPGEERLLLDEAYQDKLVQGLYNAITKYVK